MLDEAPHDWRAIRAQAQLIELAPEAILVREIGSGVILFWNRGAEELYGYTRQQALGQVSHALLRTEFAEPLVDIEARLVQTGRWEGELRHTTRDGRQILVTSKWAIQADDAGEPVAYLEVNNDITQQRQLAVEQA